MRFFAAILSVLLVLAPQVIGASTPFIMAPPSVKEAIATMMRFEPTKSILHELSKESPITIKWAPLGRQSHAAMWSGNGREIWLNSDRSWTEGQKITYILMELHNARSNSELAYLDQLAWKRQISKKRYIELVEQVEHRNALQTKNLLCQGVERGVFPVDAQYPIYQNFSDHLRLQMACGHSNFIAARFDELSRQGLSCY
jgi:hypothetical protein